MDALVSTDWLEKELGAVDLRVVDATWLMPGEGDAAAASIYVQAYGKNPQFYTYYKSLEAYRASFSKPGDVLVVDPSSSFFQFMKDPAGAALAPVTVPAK